jgi:hypothetical protein
VLFGAYGINAIWLAALISMLLAITTSWLKSPLHRNH